MDEINLLASSLPDAPPPSPAAVARARARLAAAETARPVRHRSRLRPRPWVWTAATAAATAAVILAVTAGVGAGGGSADGPATAVSAPDGRQALLDIAARAEALPAETPGAYWRRRSVTGSFTRWGDGSARYMVLFTTELDSWTPRDPRDPAFTRLDRMEGRPSAPEDVAAWREQGAPRRQGPKDALRPGGPIAECAGEPGCTPKPVGCTYSWQVDPKGILYDRRMAELTFADLEALPRDAGTLLERFKAARRGDQSPSQEQNWSFSAVSLLNLPSPPDLRAAALRVLAGLPGTRVVGEITDPLGRPGVAVRINAGETGETGMGDAMVPVDYQIILDPVTGEMTGERSTVVRDAEGVAAGTVIGYAAYTEQGWTGERPERPEGCKEGSVG
ncbi:CU044_5270 family protein [Streptosporangium sandarakinum]|uniref:CU044_5270 family protein n=1 Tax=Streptosporangium sandarakinum TaxID=1260955 RepID=UPI00371E69D7